MDICRNITFMSQEQNFRAEKGLRNYLFQSTCLWIMKDNEVGSESWVT